MKFASESLLIWLLVLLAGDPREKPEAKPADAPGSAAKPSGATAEAPLAGTVVVQLLDGGSLKLVLLDERLSMETPYGRLSVPVSDIQEIHFGLRVEPEAATRIAEAVEAMGSADFDRREKASAELLKLRERALPALMKLAANEDLEIAKRAQRVIQELQTRHGREELEISEHDEVTTVHSRIAGWISNPSLKVRTFQFGPQSLRLSDIRNLKAIAIVPSETTEAEVDPGNLAAFQQQVGKTLAFKVTGAGPGAQGSLWGTDMYTLDSNLAMASVHAGILKPGQTGVIKVVIFGPQGRFEGSQRNGITSMPYAHFNGSYRFSVPTVRKLPKIDRPADPR